MAQGRGGRLGAPDRRHGAGAAYPGDEDEVGELFEPGAADVRQGAAHATGGVPGRGGRARAAALEGSQSWQAIQGAAAGAHGELACVTGFSERQSVIRSFLQTRRLSGAQPGHVIIASTRMPPCS